VAVAKLRRRTIAVLVCGVLAVAVWFLVLSPCRVYLGLKQATTNGERFDWLALLDDRGPMGRHLARGYAIRWSKRCPRLGLFAILERRHLWIGMDIETIHRQFGPPDEVRGDADIWYIGRSYALKRLKRDRSYSWNWAWSDWDACLAAKYKGGRLVRLGDPMPVSPYLQEPEESPYRLHLKIELDPADPDAPPPEWVEAEQAARR
jgi:hypothetical protein